MNGPSGAGKSTLLRAIAGIWPFGTGAISVPKDASIMVLPQRPYLPIGTLKAAIAYPSLPEAFDSERVRNVLTAVGCPHSSFASTKNPTGTACCRRANSSG